MVRKMNTYITYIPLLVLVSLQYLWVFVVYVRGPSIWNRFLLTPLFGDENGGGDVEGIPWWKKTMDSPRLRFAVSASLALESIYWASQAVCLWITRCPSLFDRYSIRSKSDRKKAYPSSTLLRRAFSSMIQGHLLRPLILWIFYPIYARRGCFNDESISSSWLSLVASIVFSMLVDDALFYWSHRFLHENKSLYRKIHKQHHEFRYSVALGTEYAHVLEDVFSNTLPTVAGALILGNNATLAVGYMGMKLWQSIDGHSGFLLPFPLSPWNCAIVGMDCSMAHDFHHSHNKGNYGGYFIWWDRLCGTDKAYRAYREKRSL